MALTARFYLAVATTVVGASTQFYSFAVLNSPQEILERWTNATFAARGYGDFAGLSHSSLTLFWSFTVSALTAGQMAGAGSTRWLAEGLGRRGGLVLNGAVTVLGGICEALAKPLAAPELLLIGRLFLGFGIGVSCGLAPLYLTEIAPVPVRGAVGTAHQVASAFGDCLCLFLSLPELLGAESRWPLLVAFPALTAGLLCVLLPFCPESPRHLLLKKADKEAALRAAVALLGSEAEAEGLLEQLEKEARECAALSEGVGWAGWWRRPELYRPLAIVAVVMIAAQMTGASIFLSFSSEIFTKAELSLETAQWGTAGMGLCYFAATVPALWLIEGLGRRRLLLCQLAGCLVGQVALALLIWASEAGQRWAPPATIATLALFMAVYGLGSSVPWLIASEVFAQAERSTGVGLGVFVSSLFAFLVGTVYLPLQEAVGTVWSLAPFAAALLLCLGFLAWQLPETRGREIVEVVRKFSRAPLQPPSWHREEEEAEPDGQPQPPTLQSIQQS